MGNRSESGPKHLRIVDLLILAVGTFTLGVDGYVLSGLLPEVSADLRVSISEAGQLTALFAIVYAVGSPVIAALTGSWDRRVVLGGGMMVFIVGLMLQAGGPNFPTVAVGRIVAALGAAAYQANAFGTAGLLSDDAHRARSLAVVAGGASLALVAGLPFGIIVGQVWGWRNAMWILVVLAAISCLSVGLLPAAHAPRLGLRDRLLVLADARVRGILVGTLTVMVPGFLIISFLPTVLHASGVLVVVAMFAFGCGQVLGTTAVPRLIRWRGAPFVLVLGAGGVTAFAAMLAVTGTTELGAVASMIALGLSMGIAIVPQQHRLFALVPARAPVAMGLNGSAIYTAAALGAGLGGGVLAVAGEIALAPTAAIIGLLAVTAGVAVRPERRPQR
ncbi:MFS transporter [Nocardia jiangxiensis]|uniref:MFS transporter n=1 Tax=Nocardia jiangxiensis TaxID=282685 RepID=A0ABW6S3U3_9NOCA